MPKLSDATATVRAEKFVRDLKSVGGNQSELARRQGRTPQAVSNQARQPYMKSVMDQLLDKAGVTNKFIADKIKEGCEAKKLVYVENGDSEDGEKVREYDDDFSTRHKYIETALKVKGHLRIDIPTSSENHLHLHLESNREDTGERIRDFTNQLSQNNRG